MNKREVIEMACVYIYSKRHGYSDLFYYPYLPPEVKEILYKNRRRLTKFFNQHTKKMPRTSPL